MEANKQDAKKCIELARRNIQEGNREKATELIQKSEKLFPLPEAKELLEWLKKKEKTETSKDQSDKTRSNKDQSSKTGENKDQSSKTGPNKDQLDVIKRINSAKDYYAMLGVKKDASVNAITKAFKKLALLVHPDKNKNAGAPEAFKALGNAADVLRNTIRRQEYDSELINK